MNYADIKKIDVANGDGVRVSVFVSGCHHHCKGCFNECAWDFNYGNKFTEQQIDEVENRILHIRQEKLTADNIYQFLLYFDKMYDSLTDAEKKEFLNCFVESIDIFEEEQPDGRFLKHISRVDLHLTM